MNFQQPLTARFSHDSVELADRLAVFLLKDLSMPQASSSRDSAKVLQIMDLCCGCGVVGLETERRLRDRIRVMGASNTLAPSLFKSAGRRWTFLEVQDIYQDFFELNRASLHRELNGQVADEGHLGLDQFEHSVWIGMNYRNLIGLDQYRGTFDWIVSNPPYFDPTHGRLPVDKIKARSRFYLDGSFEEFLSAIRWSLAPSGKALILVRDLSDHRISRQEGLQKIFSDQAFQLDWLDPIRGTDLLLIYAKTGFSSDR
ncbi:MAG: hypothetical protein JNM39_02150 [Bdellovibrionaceae bacterium]|nr:hypothetical protein [Pseudobdellovibrionaceae bacterium]